MRLKEILPYLLHEFINEADLIRAIQELSQKFTVKRDGIADYLKDPRLASAYTAFYLTTNFPKLREIFKWLPADWLEQLKASTFVDLGAGPGTFSLAWKDWAGVDAQRIIQIERSEVMLKQARKLWNGHYAEAELEQLKNSKKLPGSFLFFGHSANEMGADQAIKYIEEIGPENVLFVEPGTKDFFPVMLQIRRYLISAGYNILYPCPLPLECPMWNSQTDWCHQFIQVRQDEEVERLSQMAHKDRKLLPLTVHAFSKSYIRVNPQERIVRVLPETKFSYEWEVCNSNKLDTYQVMKRGMDKATQKIYDNVLAGAAVESEVEKVLEKSKRVRISKFF